jgi:hypothetical protein
MASRFVAGMRYAARAGILSPGIPEAKAARPYSSWLGWLRPMLAVSAVAVLALAIAAGWLLLYKLPAMRDELARERVAREESELNNRATLDGALQELEAERQERARLEGQLAARSAGNSNTQTARLAEAQPNIPLAMLQATRDGGTSELAISAGAKSFVLWVEVEQGGRFNSFRLQIYQAGGQLVQTVEGLRRNAHGALAVSLPAALVQSGNYTIRLYGGGTAELVGEYKLQVRKK